MVVRKAVLRAVAVAVTIGAMWMAPSTATADQTSNLVFIDSFPAAGDNPDCSKGECDAIIAANEALLGVPAGSIQLIGKLEDENFSSGNVSGQLTGGEGPFVANPVTGSWVCDGAGCTLTIDFSALALDWQIVKILAKDGKDLAFGDFLTDQLLTPPLDDVQKAFISTAQIQAWCADNTFPGDCQFGKFSHIWVFGVNNESSVPEPATLMLLGLGLVGAGAAARRRFAR